MKFKVNSYHFKLLRDYERLSAFKEAIDDYAIRNDGNSNDSNSKVAFDLGCGSGVLSYFASEYMDRIIAIELNNSTYQLAKENLKEFDNIQVFNDDLLSFDFSKLNEKADLIICEMLDAALIDEEEVPVLNRARKFLKDGGEIIPCGMINSTEPVFMNNHFIQQYNHPNNINYQNQINQHNYINSLIVNQIENTKQPQTQPQLQQHHLRCKYNYFSTTFFSKPQTISSIVFLTSSGTSLQDLASLLVPAK